jgi:hypothetical protein
MIERVRRRTELRRDSDIEPPQHSVAMFHLIGVAPQALMISSMLVGCSMSVAPVTSTGRRSRQP